jgi:hypothetical protein
VLISQAIAPINAAAIFFVLHLDLPLRYPELKDALHIGWMTTFKHPMNYDELLRPPCVGDSAYSEGEQQWCAATIQYLVDSLDPAGSLSRGIPETAATRRSSWRVRLPAATAAPAASASRGRCGGGTGGDGALCWPGWGGQRSSEVVDEEQVLENNETDNETVDTAKSRRQKRTTSKFWYPRFYGSSCMRACLENLANLDA